MSRFHLAPVVQSHDGNDAKGLAAIWCARRLRDALAKGETVTQAILNAGFPDSGSYYRKADETLGITAKQFRKGGDNLPVCYALARSRTGTLPGCGERSG